MYRDSRLGVCLDLAGPDGNVFILMAQAKQLCKQIGGDELADEFWNTCTAAMDMNCGYVVIVEIVEEFVGSVLTLINKEEVLGKLDDGDTERSRASYVFGKGCTTRIGNTMASIFDSSYLGVIDEEEDD